MSTQKIERLLNLVIALRATTGYLSAEKIHRSVIGYGECVSDEAFSRMFERDKTELRDLGIPVRTGRVSTADAAEGYRIDNDDYALPDIGLTPEEAAAVAVASELWHTPEWSTVVDAAVLKLRAAGVGVDHEPLPVYAPSGLPGLGGSEEVLVALLGAIQARRAVTFSHRSSPAVPYSERTLEPWGVVTVRGRWYLVGYDRGREGVRTFRLSRIRPDVHAIGEPGAVEKPADADVRTIAADAVAGAEPGVESVQVRVWVASGRANALRRIGTEVADQQLGGRPGQVLVIEVGPRESLVRDIAGHGADAVVLAPDELRRQVIARLEGALA